LVNNAGIVATQSRVDEMARERLERMMAVNVVGAFLRGARRSEGCRRDPVGAAA
jgi:NAD(P)-dependent dehydrogenase (short-subunit alcohol dehydrogenase family)